MPPVGNDVVDLKDPENQGKSRDERFLLRAFAEEERVRIRGSADPDAFLWSFWAAKEAAYKAVSQEDPGVSSAPRYYRVVLEELGAKRVFDENSPASRRRNRASLEGRVFTPRGERALRIWVAADHVHALAAESEAVLAGVLHRVDRMDAAATLPDPSAFVRERLLREIARRCSHPAGDLDIRKDPEGPGAPRVFLRDRPLAAEISLSHDGRFTAFALLLPRP